MSSVDPKEFERHTPFTPRGAYRMRQAGLPDAEPTKSSRSPLWDKALLIGAALLLSLIGCGAFLLGEIYHVNPAWIFFALGSVGIVPLFARNFRGQFKRPAFVLFLAGWVVVHGLIVASLTHWVSLMFWLPVFGLEFLIGYLAMFWLFGAVPSDKI